MLNRIKRFFSRNKPKADNTAPASVAVGTSVHTANTPEAINSGLPIAKLYRASSSDQGTLGTFQVGDLQLSTIELPWCDNKSNISCIPEGSYHVRPHKSQKYGPCFWVEDVPNRFAILIHCGNYAGDKKKGYQTDSAGCILIGTHKGSLNAQKAVLGSRAGKLKLLDVLGEQAFTLVVKNYQTAINSIKQND